MITFILDHIVFKHYAFFRLQVLMYEILSREIEIESGIYDLCNVGHRQ